MGRLKEVNGVVLQEYARAWFIKALFIPIMFGLLITYVDVVLQWQWDGASFMPLYNHLLDIFYAVDILFAVLGYILALRFLDTHIQSTEPTVLGWAVCLACYSPFYSIFGIGLLPEQSVFQWDQWLASNPVLFYICGGSIIVLSLIYALATVAIGYRMSNLTYRGLITSGPYRFTKHPAYVSKVISWWLVSLPFLSTEGLAAASIQSLSMTAITVIYYLRAKTEENHLSNYSEYVQYANWINDHGMFSFLGKIVPALKYSEERARKSNSVVWFKKIQK
jgi:protein-S-isoprenylcysteine O-methyltransferase Ste14